MKLCIFNSLPQHHEMFAHVLDYCLQKSLKIDIYTNKEKHYGWLDFYEKEYIIFTWYPISFFNPAAYDYVFLLTDDDYGYNPFWNNTTRVIVTEHDSKRQLNLKAYRTHQTRHFKLRGPSSDPNTWIVPVWNNILYKKYETLTVLSIGNATNNLNLQHIFSNFLEINFILVDRDINCSNSMSNIKKYNKLHTSELIEYAGRSHYILFWPTTYYSQQHKYNSMSGSFPLAYSVGTPLLVPESFIEPLGLAGMVGISDHGSIKLNYPEENIYKALINQREQLLKRRNNIFDSFLFGSLDTTPLGPGMYTAIIVEPRKYKSMEFVLRNFLENLDERWSFMIFHGINNKDWLENIIDTYFVKDKHRIKCINLNVINMRPYIEYSMFMTSSKFIEQIPTETFLIFQTDTMICPKEKNLIYEFINYDYVGAPWPESCLKESCEVGNGGLSLRKKSKMLEIIRNIPYPDKMAEDLYFCGVNHTIPLYKPTWEKSKMFSIESIYSPRSFGLHKAWMHIPVEHLESDFPGIKMLKDLQSE